MVEYISKDRVKDFIHATNSVHGFTSYEDYMWILDAVVETQSADVQPVKHGEWKINSDGYYPYCSVCGTAADQLTKHLTKYCPECGARMDGDENEDNS